MDYAHSLHWYPVKLHMIIKVFVENQYGVWK